MLSSERVLHSIQTIEIQTVIKIVAEPLSEKKSCRILKIIFTFLQNLSFVKLSSSQFLSSNQKHLRKNKFLFVGSYRGS